MAFWNKYPYLNLNDLNLDYIMKKLKEVTSAEGVSYDDAITELGADNVQKAIEAMKTLIDEVALQSTNVVLLADTIPATYWENGHVYTHLQTVNIPVLMSIIGAVREGKIVVLKQTDNVGTIVERYIYLINVEDDPNNLVHHVLFFDANENTVYRLNINGLNDDANVYVDIDTKVVIPYVNTFNGREGVVVAQAGDYTANEIDYDNTGSGLTATDVQSAINEIDANTPTTYTESFNGRSGVVLPENGDYDANQIDYDNGYSGLTATNVQDAIDEIADDILSAGVASFNSRTGAVNPQSGDYDASMIAVDTSNTDLPASVNTVQKYINYEHPATTTITLTLNGAMEDTITVEDSNGVTIGTCVFASGQTSGTLTASVAPGYSDTWTFTSSVAKDTTTGTNDYSMTQTITDTVSQTVNVHPDKALYWYGNEIEPITIGRIDSNGAFQTTGTIYVVVNTNSITIPRQEGTDRYNGFKFDNALNAPIGSTLKICGTYTKNPATPPDTGLSFRYGDNASLSTSAGINVGDWSYDGLIIDGVANVDTYNGKYIFLGEYGADVDIHSIWLE